MAHGYTHLIVPRPGGSTATPTIEREKMVGEDVRRWVEPKAQCTREAWPVERPGTLVQNEFSRFLTLKGGPEARESRVRIRGRVSARP